MKNKIILALIIGFMSCPSYAKEKVVEVKSGTKEVVVGLTLLFCPMCIVPVMDELNKVKEAPETESTVIKRSLASEKTKSKK